MSKTFRPIPLKPLCIPVRLLWGHILHWSFFRTDLGGIRRRTMRKRLRRRSCNQRPWPENRCCTCTSSACTQLHSRNGSKCQLLFYIRRSPASASVASQTVPTRTNKCPRCIGIPWQMPPELPLIPNMHLRMLGATILCPCFFPNHRHTPRRALCNRTPCNTRRRKMRTRWHRFSCKQCPSPEYRRRTCKMRKCHRRRSCKQCPWPDSRCYRCTCKCSEHTYFQRPYGTRGRKMRKFHHRRSCKQRPWPENRCCTCTCSEHTPRHTLRCSY